MSSTSPLSWPRRKFRPRLDADIPPTLTQYPRLRLPCGRGRQRPRLRSLQILLLILVLILTADASEITNNGELFRSTLDRLARKGEIVVDRRPTPTPARIDEQDLPGEFRKRQNVNNPFDNTRPAQSTLSSTSTHPLPPPPSPMSSSAASSITPPPPSSPSLPSSSSDSSSDGSSTKATSTTTPSSAPTSSSGPAPLPLVFDTSLGNNFTTTSCPNFFASFMQNANFRACVPISLLLQNSNSFFTAEKSIVSITQTLDVACSVDFKACSAMMAEFGAKVRRNENCGKDYQRQNPIVQQAYNGFVAYAPMYQASCLRSSTGSYCFADAITNVSSPTDSYTYYVALGLGLPGGSRPTCNKCLQDTLSIFAQAASNQTQPVTQRYVETAQVINLSCGPAYVNSTIPTAKGSASRMAGWTGMSATAWMLTLTTLVITQSTF